MKDSPLDYFTKNGKGIQEIWSDYEYRSSQEEMAEAIFQCIEEKEILLLEAGTGIGKTLAYLLPLLWVAHKSKLRVAISTETKSLQKQLLTKDIPLAQSILGTKLKAELCLGASNFVCKRRLNETLEKGDIDANFSLNGGLTKFLDWEKKSPSGIQHDYDGDLPFRFWNNIHRETRNCLSKRCPYYEISPYFVARRLWQRASILVVNHSLLANHFVLDGKLLPEFTELIVDESHSLPRIIQNAFSSQTSMQELSILLKETQAKSKKNADSLNLLYLECKNIFEAHSKKKLRITSELPLPGAFQIINILEKLEREWEKKKSQLSSQQELDLDQKNNIELYVDELKVQTQLEQIKKNRSLLEKLAGVKESKEVIWLEKIPKTNIERNEKTWNVSYDIGIFNTPLSSSHLIQEKVLSQVSSVIFTSATLSTNSKNPFSYFGKELGFSNDTLPTNIKLSSPFDYKKQAILYLPKSIADPVYAEEQFYIDICREIHALLQLSRGGAFVLFTSIKSLKKTEALLESESDFAEKKYRICSQVSLGSANRALDLFFKNMSKNNGVLFGLATFWQGIDIPGDHLRMVIITRIPFSVPDEPVLAARMEIEKKMGGNPFYNLQLPTAILSMRQGFGRLIRSFQDRGVVSILDPRLQKKSYGKEILETLPKAQLHTNFENLKIAYQKLFTN